MPFARAAAALLVALMSFGAPRSAVAQPGCACLRAGSVTWLCASVAGGGSRCNDMCMSGQICWADPLKGAEACYPATIPGCCSNPGECEHPDHSDTALFWQSFTDPMGIPGAYTTGSCSGLLDCTDDAGVWGPDGGFPGMDAGNGLSDAGSVGDGGAPADAGTPPRRDGGMDAGPGRGPNDPPPRFHGGGGCVCRTSPAAPAAPSAALLGLAGLLAIRRRRP